MKGKRIIVACMRGNKGSHAKRLTSVLRDRTRTGRYLFPKTSEFRSGLHRSLTRFRGFTKNAGWVPKIHQLRWRRRRAEPSELIKLFHGDSRGLETGECHQATEHHRPLPAYRHGASKQWNESTSERKHSSSSSSSSSF